MPRWYEQPKYVEIWLEKDAAVETFRAMVKDRHVIIVPNGGHSSVAYFEKNVKRLKDKQAEGKTIYILYFGDYDPSGEEMDKIYTRKFAESKYSLYGVNFIRLSVTREQMEKFHLLNDPDPETLKKLQRDSNRFKFMEKYGLVKFSQDPDDEYIKIENKQWLSSYVIKKREGGYIKHDPTKLFAIQLEAMQTPKVRAYLKRLVLKAIDRLFDKGIYQQIQDGKPTPAQIKGLVRSQILGLL